MKTRIITGICIAAVLVPILLCTTMFQFIVFSGILAFIASFEMLNLFKAKKEISLFAKGSTVFLTLLNFAALSFVWYYSFSGDITKGATLVMLSAAGVVSLFNMLFIGLLLVFDKKFDSEVAGRTFLTISYVAVGFAAMGVLRTFGRGMIIYLFIVACFTDIFAYAVGMNFGKHKMAPTISPKKSWEGSIGGTIIATIIASLFALNYKSWFGFVDDTAGRTIISNFTDLSQTVEIIVIVCLTVFTSILGQIGDLVASKMKRDNDIKDYGNLFPGHGGVLDRFDSSLYVSLFLTIVCAILKAM